MPSRTAASIAAAISGTLPFRPTPAWGRPAPCSCRCTHAVRCRRPGTPSVRCRVAGRDAGDVRGVLGEDGVERLAGVLPSGEGGANARATMTFGVVSAVLPFGNPGGYV